jgi:CheY-like chemotaxis protein
VRLLSALGRAIGARDDVFRVVFVERDLAVGEILSALLGRHGVASLVAADAREAADLCVQMRPDLVLLDNDLPDVEAVDVKRWLQANGSMDALPFVTYDAQDVRDTERARHAIGAVTQILAKDQVSAPEFRWRVMNLVASPHTMTTAGDTQ